MVVVRRSWQRSRCLVVAAMIFAAATTGCASRSVDSGQDALAPEQVTWVTNLYQSRSSIASATAVSSDLFLITAHQLEPTDLSPPVLGVGGFLTRFEVLQQGRMQNPTLDYALIRVLDIQRKRFPTYDPGTRLNEGDTLFLVGYPIEPACRNRGPVQEETLRPVALPARVTFVSSDGLFVRTSPSVTRPGMSGGAAVRVDPKTGRPIVVGILAGSYGFLGLEFEDVIVRPRVVGIDSGTQLSLRSP